MSKKNRNSENEFNPEATGSELEQSQEQPASQEGEQSHTVTQQDLDNNPGLSEQGVNVGDNIEIPGSEQVSEDQPQSEENSSELQEQSEEGEKADKPIITLPGSSKPQEL